MKLAFFGSPDFAVPGLRALLDCGHEIAAVYTSPPRRASRGMRQRQTAVEKLATDLDLLVLRPETFTDAGKQQFEELDVDCGVVIAYGMLLPSSILTMPRHGFVNVHASLLPRWRGAAPINRAVMAGDTSTGISIMRMTAGLDTGPVYRSQDLPLAITTTAGEVHDRLALMGADLLTKTLADLDAGKAIATRQNNDLATYAHKISKDDTRINWRQSATVIHNQIRGLSPYPGAWCEMMINGRWQNIKVIKSLPDSNDPVSDKQNQHTFAPGHLIKADGDDLIVATGAGGLKLLVVQRMGKRAMTVRQFLSGVKADCRLR